MLLMLTQFDLITVTYLLYLLFSIDPTNTVVIAEYSHLFLRVLLYFDAVV